MQNLPKASVALIVQCRADVAVGSPTKRRIVTGDRPIFCTTLASDAFIGMCFLKAEKCNAAFERGTQSGMSYNPCAPAKGAACFNATSVIDGAKATVCSPSVRDCEAQLEHFSQSPDFEVMQTSCGVYRVAET